MDIITTNEQLKELCDQLKDCPYIAVDTEFLRERTYYAKLCLIQVASPTVKAVAIDPIANPELDLSPFFDLMADEKILKVFHAGRQDLEIFHNLTNKVPCPIYDTQIAAMVCGYGEQIGYDNLVRNLTGHEIDKSNQFTDWSRRPLTDKQLEYALNDVIYLMEVYELISAKLKKNNRETWVRGEVEILNNPDLYDANINEVWRRIKVKSVKPNVLACLQSLASWREAEARKRNIPKARIVKDEVLANIAMHLPKDKSQLGRTRGLSDDFVNGSYGSKILKMVEQNRNKPEKDCPKIVKKPALSSSAKAILEMLRMLLRIQSHHYNVAPKLIATVTDLEELARSEVVDGKVMKGWRAEIFGDLALDLKAGKIAITIKDGSIDIINL